MYPSGELAILEGRKAALRVRIAGRRWACAVAANELARPLVWIDDLLARWRQISPLAKMVGTPVALYLLRSVFRSFGRSKLLGFARMAPTIFRTARLVMQMRAAAGSSL